MKLLSYIDRCLKLYIVTSVYVSTVIASISYEFSSFIVILLTYNIYRLKGYNQII